MTNARSTSSGRLALLALAAAILLAAAAALLPRAGVDAQASNYFGHWYAKVDEFAVCPDQDEAQEDAGDYSWRGETTITLYPRSWGINNCDEDNVVEANAQNVAGAAYSGRWFLELRDAPAATGSLVDGAHINLPDSFTGRRTSGTLNRRDQAADGHWPISDVSTDSASPVEISFTIPSSYRGQLFLYVGIYFNEQGENTNVWENFTFEFDAPAPTCSLLPSALETIQNRYYALHADGTRDNDLLRIPQADRVTADQRYCAQVLQRLYYPSLSWSDSADCRLLRLISLRRTSARRLGADGHSHFQVQRTATFECSYTPTPSMGDGSPVPGYLIPPSETRTETTGPRIEYFWI